MLDYVLRNCTLFVDGIGLHGAVTTITLPKLTEKVEEHRGGGMDGPIDMALGLEKLEAGLEIADYDPRVLGLWGLAPGVVKPFTARGHLVGEDGEDRSAEINMRGRLREADPGDWKPGERALLKGMIGLRYYKLTIGDELIHEIDLLAGIRTVNGTDQNVAMRRALGL
ncbi:phage major tail tube protein [Kaustia mangrovi]|uniref:Phage major tail tube protein n=1 Tax=Kaustia mangrovi TaxID=2593653 RepID=A0A7S8HDM8_9HYPH|nr:phage major tail tube protein [Kaustia mangrovi]QPC44639.1 phage major tail tube protein [Kaustia mangrovi]